MGSEAVDLIKLSEIASKTRHDIIDMVYRAQSGHIGGSLSIVEILVALYYKHMNVDPDNPMWAGRDRLILSKGHNAPALYAILAGKGFFPADWLQTSFRRIDGRLQGHPEMHKTPGIDMTTGSLGIGLSVACGMAMGARITRKDIWVYVVLGDGETNEGQIWEAAATAAHFGLGHIIAFVDKNKLQNDGFTESVKNMEPMEDKWAAFGWHTYQVDGHDIRQLISVIEEAKQQKNKPNVILCSTIKGKGVSFMENSITFHGKSPNDQEFDEAMLELATSACTQ